MNAATHVLHDPDAARVLTMALVRAGGHLGLGRAALARLLGTSEASLSRVHAGKRHIDPGSKEGELALLFLRSYRSLDALVGGDEHKARAWMHASHTYLGGVPADLVQTVQGLASVTMYLDAMRGTL